MKTSVTTSIIYNLIIGAVFLWTLQQGCVKDIPAGGDSDSTKTGAITARTPVNITPLVRLPSDLPESSGIIMNTANRIWSHNDSGNENKLYCFDLTGTLLKTLTIENSTNTDWEDLAVDTQKRVYISDSGNNDNSRRDLAIFRIPDPETVTGSTVSAEIIRYSYDDQEAFPPPASQRYYDMEALIWYNDSLFMFTKDSTTPFLGMTRLYKIPAIPGTHIAKYSGSFYLGNTTSAARVTAADFHHASGRLALLVQERLIVFYDFPGSAFFGGKVAEYPFINKPGQAEAIIFDTDSKLYMTEEGTVSTSGFIYEINIPVK